MNNLPPPIQPTAPPRRTMGTPMRLLVVFVGLAISVSPMLFFLIVAQELNDLLNQHFAEAIVGTALACLLGSFLCLKVLIPKWWVVALCVPFLAAGFFAINAGVGLFVGCASAFSH